MRLLGTLLFIAALMVLVVGFSLDTTVASGLGNDRVHNIGLMSQKQNVIILGGSLAVAGAMLLGLAGRSSFVPRTAQEGYRSCPQCAEIVKNEAKVCRYCQRDLPSLSALLEKAEADRRQLAEIQKQDAAAAKLAEELLPKGTCPNCKATIALASLECRHCKAAFGPQSAWRVLTTSAA